MLSYIGWLNGISATGFTIFGCTFGLIIFLNSLRLKSRLLLNLGLTIFFAGLLILGPTCDFLTILITGSNLDNTFSIVGILSAFPAPLATITGMYIGAELLMPKKKKYILSIFIILGILFEFFIFFDRANTFSFTYPINPGEDIIDTQVNLRSTGGLLAIVFIFSLLIFNGFGFMRKAIQTSGVLRKKFLYLSIGYFLYLTSFLLETTLSPGIILFFIRVSLIVSFCLWYLGVKEEPEKIKKEPSEEISEKTIITLYERLTPVKISEEEITSYREKQICLVCKGDAKDSNYICTKCTTIYCLNCSKALSEAENVCWICNEPIDKSKPSIIFEKEILKEEKKTEKRLKKDKKKEEKK